MLNKFINKKLFSYSYTSNKIFVKTFLPYKNKKNIKIGIIIDTVISIPPTTGVTYRLYYLSKKLSKLGYKIVWFLGNRNFSDEKSLEQLKIKGVKIYLLPPKLFYNIQFLNSLILKEDIDILQYEITQTFLSLGIPLQRLNNLPTLLEIHDVEASLRKTLGRKKEVDFMNFLQFVAGNLSDAVIAMTIMDRRILIDEIKIPKEKIFLAPNGIEASLPYNGINKKESVLLCLGNMFYPPNKNGLLFLIKKVIPLVKKSVVDIKLKVIGMVPIELKNKYKKRKEIIFTGEIRNDNLFNKELSSSTIGLCTVFAGSGMKVKILNYCASGLPVIVTPLGLSGYEKIKSLIKVEPKANSIAGAIIKLIEDKKKLVMIGKENRRKIIKLFNWGKITKEIIKAYNFAYNIRNAITHKLKIPTPLWLEEGRHSERILEKYYIINAKEISKKFKT